MTMRRLDDVAWGAFVDGREHLATKSDRFMDGYDYTDIIALRFPFSCFFLISWSQAPTAL